MENVEQHHVAQAQAQADRIPPPSPGSPALENESDLPDLARRAVALVAGPNIPFRWLVREARREHAWILARRRLQFRINGNDDTSSDDEAGPIRPRRPRPPVPDRFNRRFPPFDLAEERTRWFASLTSRFHVIQVENAPSSQPYHLPSKADRLIEDLRTRTNNRQFRQITYQGNPIHMERIRSLLNSGHLSRVVVSAYMEMIVSRNDQEGLPGVYAVDPDIVCCILKEGSRRAVELHGQGNLGDKKILFFPILKKYWSLVVVDMDEKLMDYYDVLREEYRRDLSCIAAYLKKTYLPNLDLEEWGLRYRKDFPVYSKEVSGLFVLQVAEWVSRRQGFEAPSFPFLRKKILLELSERRFYLN